MTGRNFSGLRWISISSVVATCALPASDSFPHLLSSQASVRVSYGVYLPATVCSQSLSAHIILGMSTQKCPSNQGEKHDPPRLSRPQFSSIHASLAKDRRNFIYTISLCKKDFTFLIIAIKETCDLMSARPLFIHPLQRSANEPDAMMLSECSKIIKSAIKEIMSCEQRNMEADTHLNRLKLHL